MFSTLLTPIIVYNSIIFITFAATYKQIIMMKKISLLFFIFILTLLGGNGAYAQDEAFYFATWGSEGSPTINYGNSWSNSYGLTCNYLTAITTSSGTHNLNRWENAYRFACRQWVSNNQRGWNIYGSGLQCVGPDYAPELVICNLWNGNSVKITFTGGIKFKYANSAKVNGTFVTEGQYLTS